MNPEEAVLKDYEATLAFIDKMDQRLDGYRNLAIVSCSAVIAYSISEKAPAVLLANFVLAPAFLLLELVNKCFHENAIAKAFDLEDIIQMLLSSSPVPSSFQFGIGHAIQVPSLAAVWRIFRSKGRWHLRLLYLIILLCTAVAWAIALNLRPA